MDIKTGVGTAIGKIILMGEHSVVYGEPAIAIPFSTAKIISTISKINGPVTIDCHFYNGILSNAPKILNGLTTIVKEIVQGFGQNLQNFSIKIESTIPPERGMGSSAAVAIATTRALFDYFSKPLTNDKLLDWASISEKIVHGNPSGIDAAIISGETPLFFIKGDPFESFTFKLDAYLIVADTGELGNTKVAVRKVRDLIEFDTVKGMDLVKKLGNLTRNVKSFIKKNDIVQIGDSMSKAHAILDKLGVSNEKLNRLVSVAESNGALGAKLTGGGLGGCIIVLAANRQQANYISNRLLENGATNTWTCNLGVDIS